MCYLKTHLSERTKTMATIDNPKKLEKATKKLDDAAFAKKVRKANKVIAKKQELRDARDRIRQESEVRR